MIANKATGGLDYRGFEPFRSFQVVQFQSSQVRFPKDVRDVKAAAFGKACRFASKASKLPGKDLQAWMIINYHGFQGTTVTQVPEQVAKGLQLVRLPSLTLDSGLEGYHLMRCIYIWVMWGIYLVSLASKSS